MTSKIWIVALFLLIGPAIVHAQDVAPPDPAPAESVVADPVNDAPLRDRMTMKQIIETGGVPMYILGAMSVVGVALTLYFLMVLRENQVMPRKFVGEIRHLLAAGRLDDAFKACARNRSAVSEVAMTAIEYSRHSEETDPGLLKDIIEGEGGRQATLIQNQIQYLQDIAVIAPMIGLLGTVLGMLTAFNAVALDIAKAKPMVLAAGVSQALITTAAGLIVGIPAMMAYAFFRGRSSKLISGLETASADLLTALVRKKRSP